MSQNCMYNCKTNVWDALKIHISLQELQNDKK